MSRYQHEVPSSCNTTIYLSVIPQKIWQQTQTGKKGSNYGKCKVAENYVESVDIPVDVAPQGFSSTSNE